MASSAAATGAAAATEGTATAPVHHSPLSPVDYYFDRARGAVHHGPPRLLKVPKAAAVAARASRSFVSARASADDDVGLWIAECEGSDMDGTGNAKVSKLLVCTRSGTWQPASSLYEFVQQIVMELIVQWVKQVGEAKADFYAQSDVDSDDEYDESWGYEGVRGLSPSTAPVLF